MISFRAQVGSAVATGAASSAAKGKVVSITRKKLIRRTDRDYSQQLRLAFQLAFVTLNVWIGVQFYHWVRWAETGGATREVTRPAGVEGWLPIAGLMQTKYCEEFE